MALWIVLAVVAAEPAVVRHQDPIGNGLVAGWFLVAGGIAVWYFYRKRSVVAYYRAVAARSQAEPDGRGA